MKRKKTKKTKRQKRQKDKKTKKQKTKAKKRNLYIVISGQFWTLTMFLYLFCVSCGTLPLCPPIPFGCSGDLALTNWSSGRKSSRTGGREGGKGGKKTGKGEGEEKMDKSSETSFGTP